MEDNELISRGTSMESERSHVVGGIRIVVHYAWKKYAIYYIIIFTKHCYTVHMNSTYNIMIYETWMVGIFS